ncbi:MAG: FAD-binding oxidoreductase [Gemmatimonadetes bacterium]|nr:MAG: FAD-binding oxidoreductase [Gemmatimonadota bacterium]
MSGGVAQELRRMLADDQVIDGLAAEPWAVCDRVPQAVAFPGSESELAGVLERASAEGWTVAPAGRATWLFAGHPPRGIDVVVSLKRLERVLEYEPADLTVTVEAGVGLDVLAARVREHRQWLPLDPAGSPRGTLGATLGTASWGPLEAGFGRPRDQVLGARIVTGDGRVLALGGRVVKNVAGFDVLRAQVGAWGTLGVLTSATVRLHPLPEADRTLLFTAPAKEELVSLARALACAPVPVAALELMAPGERDTGATVSVLAARLLGTRDEIEGLHRALATTVPGAQPRLLEGEASAALFRNMAAVEDGAQFVVRLSALPDRLGWLFEQADRLAGLSHEAVGFGARVTAHVAAGTVRVIVAVLERSPGWVERTITRLRRVREELAADGGTLVITRAPPELVSDVGAWGIDPGTDPLIRGLKQHFDPAGILCPGRMEVV